MEGVLKNEREKSEKKFGTGRQRYADEGEKAGAGYWTKCASYAAMNASM